MTRILIAWGNWGPYHYTRFKSLHDEGQRRGTEVVGLELFHSSGHYTWESPNKHPAVHQLKIDGFESDFPLWALTTKLLPFLFKQRPDVILVPSYWHWSLFLNYAGRLAGAKIVMMNESHAATEQATGIKRRIKKVIVRDFHAGFVGGSPHKRHFASLGLNPEKIFLGYDAVDNDYFTERSTEIRQSAETFREELNLPEHYFLNLGRMVAKKNLSQLIRAFAALRRRRPDLPHDLVFVGSGEEESALRSLASKLDLEIENHIRPAKTPVSVPTQEPELVHAGHTGSERSTQVKSQPRHRKPTIHFYGFRQINENPVFYALATAFILPSTREEWGLVINEAMASGLPVIASDRLGCAEDLVQDGRNGFAIDPDSVEELTDALEKVTDPETASRLGEKSLQIISHWGCNRFASGGLDAAMAALKKSSDNSR